MQCTQCPPGFSSPIASVGPDACAPLVAAASLLSSVSPAQLFADLQAKPCTQVLAGDFGGLRLTPGVYCIESAATFSQNVVLDAQGKDSSSFVFRIGGAFDSVATRSILTVNGRPQVFYAVDGAATLDALSRVYGTIVAKAAITLGSSSSISGRALSLAGVVNVGDDASIGPQLLSRYG